MERVLARFDDLARARGAVRSLVAASFPGEDLRMYAVLADGGRVAMPVGVRSHAPHGAAIGLLLTVPVGIVLGLQSGVPPLSAAIGMGGAGVILGATIGLGSWSVAAGRAPDGATGFLVAVDAPAGRVAQARSVLGAAGGEDATLSPVS